MKFEFEEKNLPKPNFNKNQALRDTKKLRVRSQKRREIIPPFFL